MTANARDWQARLHSEFREALSSIGFGLFGTFFLGLFAYGFLVGRAPQGRIGVILLMGVAALVGPFLLFAGVKELLKYYSRRRRFAALSKANDHKGIDELVLEIYGPDNKTTGKSNNGG